MRKKLHQHTLIHSHESSTPSSTYRIGWIHTLGLASDTPTCHTHQSIICSPSTTSQQRTENPAKKRKFENPAKIWKKKIIFLIFFQLDNLSYSVARPSTHPHSFDLRSDGHTRTHAGASLSSLQLQTASFEQRVSSSLSSLLFKRRKFEKIYFFSTRRNGTPIDTYGRQGRIARRRVYLTDSLSPSSTDGKKTFWATTLALPCSYDERVTATYQLHG
jgi:hypothetical protein